MKVNSAIIVPFNNWWRQTNHCEPSVEVIDAFEAGFKAGAEYAKAAHLLDEGADEIERLERELAIRDAANNTIYRCFFSDPFYDLEADSEKDAQVKAHEQLIKEAEPEDWICWVHDTAEPTPRK